MRLIAATLAAVVAGCATTYEDGYRYASGLQDWDLCYLSISGRAQPNTYRAVNDIIAQRRIDCRQHMGIVQAKMSRDAANSAAQTSLGLQLMQAGKARPAAPPAPTTCRTYDRGGYLQTVCD